MSRRFYDPQPFSVGNEIDLGESASHHIGRVLRMRVGDELTVFNGEGGEFQAKITSISKRAVTVLPSEFDQRDRTAALAVTIALPFIKGERMDYAIQKATEMGASAFHLVQCARSDVRLDGDRARKKLDHLQQVAISACEQCGMNRVPMIDGITSFSEFVSTQTHALKLVGHPGEKALGYSDFSGHENVLLLTGPEGGFSDEELALAKDNHFQSFALGERVLRAETAPVALLASIWTLIANH
ncbi:MAG: 16S rRNA (uracil(1498)-N(3))-methyltransferase [Alcanivoracaceae bacterium]|nr:16S rRNA (uracil(1498)-N(3))-methyltransferase [Alcanivoracaceae bacterium]